MNLLAIDPGPVESAYLIYDTRTGLPGEWKKAPNDEVLIFVERAARLLADRFAIEMVGHYGSGMPAGKTIFDTCVWIGRFIQQWGRAYRLVYRGEVKIHICGSMRADDATIKQALWDRYGPGKELAVGLKATPGPLYGMNGDVRSALAVAITAAET